MLKASVGPDWNHMTSPNAETNAVIKKQSPAHLSKHKKSLSLDASETFAPETEPEDSEKKEGVEFEVNLLWFIIREASVNVHVFVSRTKIFSAWESSVRSGGGTCGSLQLGVFKNNNKIQM